MPKKSKTLCVDDLRHAEYYGMQGTFDELFSVERKRTQSGQKKRLRRGLKRG